MKRKHNYNSDEEINKQVLDEMIETILSGNFVCFVDRSDIIKIRGLNRLERAQGVKDLIEKKKKDSYQEFIYTTFKEKDTNQSEDHCLLLKLPFQHVLTTNYDVCLEHADNKVRDELSLSINWKEKLKVEELLDALGANNSRRRIFHIHGIYDDINSIVFTSREYTECYDNTSYMKNTLWTILTTKRVLFVGYRFNDDDEYVQILKKCKFDFDRVKPRHYTLYGININDYNDKKKRIEIREMLTRKYSVEPIFYPVWEDNGAENHSELRNILYAIYSTYKANIEQEVENNVNIGSKTDRQSAERLRQIMRANYDYSRRSNDSA